MTKDWDNPRLPASVREAASRVTEAARALNAAMADAAKLGIETEIAVQADYRVMAMAYERIVTVVMKRVIRPGELLP